MRLWGIYFDAFWYYWVLVRGSILYDIDPQGKLFHVDIWTIFLNILCVLKKDSQVNLNLTNEIVSIDVLVVPDSICHLLTYKLEKAMALYSSTLAWKIHGQRSLVGCSPWGRQESDTTERLHFHFSLSCIGEGNGNPLQCSCLENPRDGGAWWAAVYGVAQSRTRLKLLSISISISNL